jgi:hypothetical protein
MAAARARESERADRLFDDPLAAALAGPEGFVAKRFLFDTGLSCRFGVFSETDGLIYAGFCMSIWSALQAVARLSCISDDFAEYEHNHLQRLGAGRPLSRT